MVGTLVGIAAVLTLLVALNALYVAAEFATVSARKPRVRTLAEEGSGSAERLLEILEDPVLLDRYIAACQIGITISSLVVGIYGQAQLTPFLGPYLSVGVAATLVLLLLTTLQVILGELVPKSVAMRFPERLALATSVPMRWSLFILRPFIALLNGSAIALMRVLGLERVGELHAHSPEELELIFRESAEGGYLDADERDMLERVLAIDNQLTRQIMVPRTRTVFASVDKPAKALLAELSQTPHTRFPAVGGGVDEVVGLVHLRDLYALARRDPDADVKSILREALLLPESNTVSEVWDAMQSGGEQLTVLFDEYGGTVGIVTLEDILEEVVGEVEDEFDNETQRIVEDTSGNLLVRGDVTVSALNRELLLDLPTGLADTVGGLLIELLGRAPAEGDKVEHDGVVLWAEEVSGNAVRQVKVALPDTHEVQQSQGVTEVKVARDPLEEGEASDEAEATRMPGEGEGETRASAAKDQA